MGCGRKREDGYINLDKNPMVNPDIVRDIEKGLPWNDNTFDEIMTEHTLEHMKDLIFVMNEFWRVLKKKGKLKITVPAMYNPYAWTDPTHVRFFNTTSFDFFIYPDYNSHSAGVWGYYKPKKIRTEKGQNNVPVELYFELEVIKGKKNERVIPEWEAQAKAYGKAIEVKKDEKPTGK